MKRFLLWALLLTLYIPVSLADATISYVGSSPASGESISSFDISLEFNYDGLIADLGEGDYGIGWQGYYNAKRPQRTSAVELYEGDRDSGVFLARTMTSNVSGASDGFQIGNKVNISFPDIIPENGKTYSVYVSNIFYVNKKGETTRVSSNSVNFYGASTDMDASYNLVLTYTGKSSGSESLALESTSLRSQQDLDVLSAITYSFNNPVSVSTDAKIQLKEGENIIAASTKFDQPDEKSVTFSFDEVELLLSHSYVLTLPEGVVSMTSDNNQKNAAFDITLNGSLSKLIGLGTVTPPTDEKQIISSVNASFNVPDGYKFYAPEGLANKYVAKLYQSEISDGNLLASIQGVISQGNTVAWDLPSMSLMPSTRYILYVPEGQFWVYDTNNKRANEYSNEEVRLEYTTPSIEEAGYAPLELGKPTLPNGTVLNEGDTFSSLEYFDIAPPELRYEYDGKRVGFWEDDKDRAKGYLYDVTEQTPVLVKEFNVRVQTKETATEYYNALRFNVNSILYEGHDYRIEMPEGAFTIQYEALHNYIRTPAFSINLKGATPTEINLTGTSIEDGAERSSLSDVIFNFNGDLTLDNNAVAILNEYNEAGTLRQIFNVPMTAYVVSNRTAISAHVGNQATGEPRALKKDYTYTLTIPAGCVYVSAMPEIANKETTLTIKGVEAPPVVTEPEYVTLKVSYMTPVGSGSAGEYNSSDYTTAYSVYNAEFVKGKSISLAFDTNIWEVKHLVRFNGNATKGTDLYEFAENGTYTSSALNDNARFEIVLDYKGDIVFSNTTGIAELDKLDVRVYSDGDNIMVEGVEGGEHITVYSPTGIVIGTHDAVSTYDTVAIHAPKGQTYIVRIQRGSQTQAAKIMH